MPVADANIPVGNIGFFNLTPRVSGKFAAVRSLEVAEFDDCDRSVFVTLEMPCLADQERHHFLIAWLVLP